MSIGKAVMPRHRQLAVGLGLALTLLGIVGWISFASTTELIAATQRVRQTYRVRQRLQTVLNLMRDAETGVRGYLLTGAEEMLQPYHGARKGIDRDLKDLRRRTAGNPEQQQWLEQLEPLIARRFKVLDTIIAVRRTEGLAAAAARLRAGVGRELADEIRNRVSQMKHAEAALLLKQERDSQARTRRALAAVGTSAALGLAILLVVVYLLSREIVERERAEEALRRSETHFRSLTENALDLITVVNRDGTIRYASPSNSRVLGYPSEALLTENLVSRVHPDDQALVLETFARVSQTAGVSDPIEVRVQHADGSWRVLEARTNNLLDDPVMGGLVINSRDVTDRKQAEELARHHQAELAHALRVSTIGELAAGLAHEINQPLAAIVSYAKGCARRIRTGAGAPGDLLGAVEEIAAQAVRADQIVRRLRDFVRKQDPRRERVDPNHLVREAVRLVASEGRQRQVALRLDLAPHVPAVWADGIQIEQVILNLIRNAFEAMQTVDVADRGLVVRTAPSGEAAVEIAVSDAGPGITPEHADAVFDPFFTTKPDGLGIGLAISRSIVEAHGGRLWATPNPQRGATFHFTIPTDDHGHRHAA